MKLFLTSNASHVLKKIVPLLPKSPSQLVVAFVPTASNVYDNPWWLEEDRKALQELGFYVFDVALEGKTETVLRKEFSGVDIIFVAGGNTFYLLEQVRKSGFDTLLPDLLKKDTIYIGSSAGSVLLGPNIESVQVFDDVKKAQLDSYEALGLVDFVVLPHYKNPKFDQKHDGVVKEFKEKYTLQLLTDDEFIIVTDDKHELIS